MYVHSIFIFLLKMRLSLLGWCGCKVSTISYSTIYFTVFLLTNPTGPKNQIFLSLEVFTGSQCYQSNVIGGFCFEVLKIYMCMYILYMHM